MLESCLLFMLSSFLLISDYNPLIKTGIAAQAIFNKPIRYVCLMHISESVPPRLLPFAFGMMDMINAVFSTAFTLFSHFIPSWRWNPVGLGLLMGMAGILYAFCAPSALLLDLVNKKGKELQDEITKILKNGQLFFKIFINFGII